MRIQLIQQKVPIGSQVTFTMKTGERRSGSLTELGKDYVVLDVSNGQAILDVKEIEGIHLGIHVDESDSSVSSEISLTTSEDPENIPLPTKANPQLDDNQILSTSDESESVVEQESPDVAAVSTEDSNSSEDSSIPVEEPENSDSIGIQTDFVDPEEQLDEIEKRFKNEIEDAKIELEPPDFTFPADELKGWQNTSIAGKWVQIKNKYENAQRINELSTKFGRIQPLLSELTPLVRRFPNSPSLKRVFAYFNVLSHPDDWQKTIQIYQEVAINSNSSNDWFNVAVSALNLNKEELACYSLEKFFQSVSVIDAPNAWYIYISLVEKFNNLPAFRELCKTDEDDVADNEIEVLFDTAIYLLKKVTIELAAEIVQKRMKGELVESLLKEVCQKLGGQSTESYRQFLSEFMTKMIVSEKKTHSLTPEYPERSGPVRKSIDNISSQKQDAQTQNEDPYASAKRADVLEKDLEKAERLYRECIKRNIRYESVIKDLAMVLVRLGKPEEAVDLLEKNRQKVKDKQALDNVLITVYPAAAQYEKAIDLLNNALKQAQDQDRRLQIRMQIASAYIKLEDYVNAENQFYLVQKLRPQNITVQRNLAFCLSKQERYDEAKQILNKIQSMSSDVKTTELLDAIERAQSTGKFTLDEDTIIEVETVLSYLSGELSDFAQFFLDRCEFDGISPDRVNEGKYTGSEKDFQYDIGRLEEVAKQLGTRRPRDRSSYYLSTARIYYDLGENQNLFYRYLCRSLTSRGDAAVSENKHLDTVREWYCEALTAYDGDKTRRKKNEQDAVNSLVRYLYSTLGHAHIDVTPNKIPSVDKALSDVISNHPDEEIAFDAIAYLVSRSRYAANKVLTRLYQDKNRQNMALNYLKSKNMTVPNSVEHFNDFGNPWNELRHDIFNKATTLSNELQLLENFDLTTSWLEDNIRFAEDIRSSLFFELDQQRIGELQRILESGLELCKQVTFEERERLCFQLRSFCQDLLRDIGESPTKLSVEDIYPIIEIIQEKVDSYLKELYEASKPQLTLRLPVESYVPDTDQQIEVQIVLENERGRSPAESLKLVVQKDDESFELTKSEIKQNESLRGGEQSILTIPLRVTPDALQSRTFSLSLCAQYRTRTEEQVQTSVQNLSIRLYSEDKFEKIENPYATYAEGGIVGDAEMFFGREELIQNISQAIRESRTQSKSVIVFGQKRSGKSSVLYHLNKALEKDKEFLILDLGNTSTLLDQHAQISLLHQFLNGILRGLERAIRRKQRDGFSSLELAIPGREFYDHPAPLQLFEDTFVKLKDLTDNQTGQEDWRGIRVVLLIDEFQYIYDPIIEGKIPDSFMQNWKALLQANYFSAVLVGQDVMQKFKLRFPNEFGTTQDERVTYLNKLDATKLIEDPIRIGDRQGESRYREQATERILELTAGSPFYIQIICNRLVEYMNVKHAGLVTEADVETVKNELIDGVNALGLDKFDNLINSGDTSPDAIPDEDALKVLKTIADNSSKTDLCHRDKIDCETHLPVDTILDDLVNRDVVKRRDQSYQIQVGLFKKWLDVNG